MNPPASKSVWFREATVRLPTWRSWACLFLILAALLTGTFVCAGRLLSLNRPVPANILVVEGWLPDYALQQALAEYRSRHYDYLVTSGGPIETGSFVSRYGTFAALAGETLRRLGLPDTCLIEAPAAKTLRNRTFESAKAVHAKLNELGIEIHGLNVVSGGPHARRTRLVYSRQFGSERRVGVISVAPQDYDPARWWASSEGMTDVTVELLKWAFGLVLNSGR